MTTTAHKSPHKALRTLDEAQLRRMFAAYQSDEAPKVRDLARRFGITPAEFTRLRIEHNVPERKAVKLSY